MMNRKILYTITLRETEFYNLRTILNATYNLTLAVGEPSIHIQALYDRIMQAERKEEEPHGSTPTHEEKNLHE